MRDRFDSNFQDLERKDELGPLLRVKKDEIERRSKRFEFNDAQEELSMQQIWLRSFPGRVRRETDTGIRKGMQQFSRAHEDRFGSSPSAAINKHK